MQYNGGKHRLSKTICSIINGYSYTTYIEPFLGGCNVAPRVSCKNKVLSDSNTALISMWKAAKNGFIFPDTISEIEYKNAYLLDDNNPLKAFILIGCSFGGIWKGGYARGINGNYAKLAKSGIEKKINMLGECQLLNNSYSDINIPENSLIYCDPPYIGTRGYPATGAFNHDDFWNTCNSWAKESIVLVSECTIPDVKHQILFEKITRRTLGNETRPIAIEKLIRVMPC